MAIDYAFKHGYNLIVERNEDRTAIFDVLLDIDETCTEGISLELSQTEEVLIEPDMQGWTSLMFLALLGICKRCWTVICRSFRSIWNRHIYWGIRDLKKHRESAASFCFSLVAPRYRHVAGQRRWADVQFTFRQGLSNSSSVVIGFARQFASALVVTYQQEIIPFIRRTASRCWWSNCAVAFRRWAHRHSRTPASDLSKRFAASIDSLYTNEIAPRLRQVIAQNQQESMRDGVHRVWRSSLLAFSSLARRFAAAAVVFYNPEVAPFILHAAGSFRRAEIGDAYLRSVEAVTKSRHSNTSQLG
ncbi:MAG: hypothetical protein EPN47_08185 [Acidobacteria bacterium]|nr:MAG: hypothetical protein EPN47_08185 [Acidobacteriota bacterium]